MLLQKNNFLQNIAIILVAISLFGCGTSKKITNNEEVVEEVPENVFQAVTWNIEAFPKHATTISTVQTLVEYMGADIFAIQEISETDDFLTLIEQLNDYDGTYSYPYHQSEEDYFNPVTGFLYNTNTVQLNSHYKIFQNDGRRFPRTPYIYDFTWKGENIIIINLHLKAMGDNYIDFGDEWDEEVRRYDALVAIHDYIEEELEGKKVIVVGDFNDQIEEPISTNVFTSFINSSNFEIADMEMTNDSSNFSYPSWPSHLDHIIISDELYPAFAEEESACYTIKIEEQIGTFSTYDSTVSDHRPVIIKLQFDME